MKLSGLVGRTLRSAPAGVPASIGLASRAGMLRPVPGGLLLLPLGAEVLRRIEGFLLDGLGFDSVSVLAEPGRELEAVAGWLAGEVQSYRQLPLRIATSSAGWSDGRDGVGRVVGADLHMAGAFADSGGADAFVTQIADRMTRLAQHCGLTLLSAGDQPGPGDWFLPGPDGAQAYRSCAHCRTRQRLEWTRFRRSPIAGASEELRLVHTPGATTIESLTQMLGVERARTLKALFLAARTGELIFAVVRGDLDVSIEKLSRLVGRADLRPATESEIVAAGAMPGFASPVGLPVRSEGDSRGVLVALDESVFTGRSFVAGANRLDYHYLGVDPERDLKATFRGDLALAPEDAVCEACGSGLAAERGTVLAARRVLPSPSYSDERGVARPGCAVGVTIHLLAWFEQILLAAADEAGIAWPALTSPADVHVVDLKAAAESQRAVESLEAAGVRVLLDDRSVGAGAKFTDADLIGCPLRVTVSPRSLEAGGAELSYRRGASLEIVPLESLATAVDGRLSILMSS